MRNAETSLQKVSSFAPLKRDTTSTAEPGPTHCTRLKGSAQGTTVRAVARDRRQNDRSLLPRPFYRSKGVQTYTHSLYTRRIPKATTYRLGWLRVNGNVDLTVSVRGLGCIIALRTIQALTRTLVQTRLALMFIAFPPLICTGVYRCRVSQRLWSLAFVFLTCKLNLSSCNEL